MKSKVLIIGAGPAGLALAHSLIRNGITDILVVEGEDSVGGLCRSRELDGAPLDIGGGHFLDVRRPDVTRFLFSFMPKSEWGVYERDSRISFRGRFIGSPFESNIWQLDEEYQEKCLRDIANAGCNRGEPCPQKFIDWIYWKFGCAIAEDYMLPYNRKMFGDNLNMLGTYWLEKLPVVSYADTLRSCREHRSIAVQPGHVQFYYPKKYGYGEVWRRMGEMLGDRLILRTSIRKFDITKHCVNDCIYADLIVNTAPWTSFELIVGLSKTGQHVISTLRHTSVDIDYVSHSVGTKAQWVYIPDSCKTEHRWLVRKNFCPGARGYWKETRTDRNGLVNESETAFRYTNRYAYPLNTIGKNEAMSILLRELKSHNIFGLGRWGEWQHYNSDIVVQRAMILSEKISK